MLGWGRPASSTTLPETTIRSPRGSPGAVPSLRAFFVRSLSIGPSESWPNTGPVSSESDCRIGTRGLVAPRRRVGLALGATTGGSGPQARGAYFPASAKTGLLAQTLAHPPHPPPPTVSGAGAGPH